MQSYRPVIIALAWLVAIWVAGCSGQPTASAPAEHIPTPEAGQPTVEATSLPIPGLSPQKEEISVTSQPRLESSAITPPPGAASLVELARADLARRLGLAREAIRLVSAEAVDWSNTSLGCPQPGMMYAEVITPGYRLVLEAAGQTYAYHTDQQGQVILCQPAGVGQGGAAPTPSPARIQVAPPAGADQAVRLAREDLARRLVLAAEAIQVVSAERVEWSDASLGCPQPGMMYAQVITPGYLVILEAGGKRYEYHTDEGRFVVLCEQARSAP